MNKINYLTVTLLIGLMTSCQFQNNQFVEEELITISEAGNSTKPASWDFDPTVDNYDNNSLLDLRYLNEKVAGETGFIRLSPNRKDFVKGDGTSMRFWAVNSDVWKKGYQELKDNARFLAKRGVNMVRWHGQIIAKTDNNALKNIDEQARQQLWQYVAAMANSP